MQVKDALYARKSVRKFLPKEVSREQIEALLNDAARAPSGGNVQPWHVHVVAGESRDALIAAVAESAMKNPAGEGYEYPIYPEDLKPEYHVRRGELAGAMFELMGVARDDRKARAAAMMRNFVFFDAPVGLFFTLDRQMGSAQWSDVGGYLQSIMLLAVERGMATCPQEAWSMWNKSIARVLDIPDHHILFCGMALGYEDTEAPVNKLVSKRVGLDEFVHWHKGT